MLAEQEAYNGVQPLKPWMIGWLIDNVMKPDAPPNLWLHGMSLLAYSSVKGFEDDLRRVFLAGLKDPSVNVRTSAVIGLRGLSLRKSDLRIYKRFQLDKNPDVRRMLLYGLATIKKPWTARLLLKGLGDRLSANQVICADGLAQLKYSPALPSLMQILKHAPTQKSQPLDDVYRAAGDAATKIAGLTEYDFRKIVQHRSRGDMRVWEVLNRDDIYRKEATRLIRWWESEGRRQYR